GRSTTLGRLAYELGKVDQKVIDTFEKESTDEGSSKYAQFYNIIQLEDTNAKLTLPSFDLNLPKNNVTIMDASSQRNFIKDMMTGTSSADVAALIVPADVGGFEGAFSKEGQTREHALLAFTLGIKDVIVGVNKMDACNFSEERFNEISREAISYLTKIGFKAENILCIPYSGFTGDNLIESSTTASKMPWYKGWTLGDKSGITLIDAFDTLG
ncbi:P-loop containing nucleoside triphosphate hydrolase protein, partial [Chlamydoabsidia padenii]